MSDDVLSTHGPAVREPGRQLVGGDPPMPDSWKVGAVLGAIVVASVLLRLPFLHVPMITDEGGCAYVAAFWSRNHELYRDINYERLQGLFLAYKAILATFGESTAAIRWAASFYSAGTTVAVFVVARAMSTGRVGLLAAGLFSLFCAAPAIEGFTANAELFAILPLTVSAWAAWKRNWWWAGLLAGLAVLFKPIGVSGWLLAVAWAALSERDNKSVVWRTVLVVTTGFAVGPVLSVAHGASIGFEHYWRVLVEQRLFAFSIVSTSGAAQLRSLAKGVADTHVAWVCPVLLAVAALVHGQTPVRRFGIAWLASTGVGLSLGGDWFWHYFVQLVPPACVLGAVGIARARERGRQLVLLWGVPALLGCGYFAVRQGPYWTWDPARISWELYHRREYLVADEVSAFIRQTTAPSDTIYVAFGQADLYYRARRRAAVPNQLFWRQLETNDRIWSQVVDAIAQRKPEVVVLVQAPPARHATPRQFLALLQQGYARDPRMPLLPVYRRRPPELPPPPALSREAAPPPQKSPCRVRPDSPDFLRENDARTNRC